MRDFLIQASITLGVVASAIAMFACILTGHHILGVLLLLCILVILSVVVVIISRRRGDDEIDPISKSTGTLRQVKNPPSKKVYENDAAIWDQMKNSQQQ